MIQPVKTGQALLHEIELTVPERGQLAIWWLGQSGYVLKSHANLLYIDLYLSEHLTTKYAGSDKPHVRMTAAPLRGDQITNARYVLSSHKHSDHLDPGTLPALFAASPEARLLLPAALIGYAESLGLPVERLIGATGESSHMLGDMRVQTLPSAHPGLDRHPQHGHLFLGFLIEMDGIRIYHSGDTLVYPGLSDRLRAFGPDIAFLPINGTDARRDALGVPPNMSGAEALQLAQEASLSLVIPHHYDMFTFNTADVAAFDTIAQQQNVPVSILRPGELYIWRS